MTSVIIIMKITMLSKVASLQQRIAELEVERTEAAARGLTIIAIIIIITVTAMVIIIIINHVFLIYWKAKF